VPLYIENGGLEGVWGLPRLEFWLEFWLEIRVSLYIGNGGLGVYPQLVWRGSGVSPG
jgi:hypothetical protein